MKLAYVALLAVLYLAAPGSAGSCCCGIECKVQSCPPPACKPRICPPPPPPAPACPAPPPCPQPDPCEPCPECPPPPPPPACPVCPPPPPPQQCPPCSAGGGTEGTGEEVGSSFSSDNEANGGYSGNGIGGLTSEAATADACAVSISNPSNT